MAQVARNLTDAVDGCLSAHRILICDRDTKFTAQLKHAPNCNAYAERFVLSIKSECPNRMIFFGETSLRHAITEHVVHYHGERAHQGIGNERIERALEAGHGEVMCDERLGGLRKCDRRAA
jgi:putative transposase